MHHNQRTVLLHYSRRRLWIRERIPVRWLFLAVEMQEIPDSFGTCHLKRTCLKPVHREMQNLISKNKKFFYTLLRTSATPRSEILSVPSVVSKRLLGFMSLCIMPWLCKYSSPAISWQKYLYNENRNVKLSFYEYKGLKCCLPVGLPNWELFQWTAIK